MSSMTTLHDVIRINSVRVDQVLLARLLDLLDTSQPKVASEHRRGKRVRYRLRNAVVMPGDGAADVAFVVPTRNLSQQGMAFLHSHMMHVGRPCTVQLPTRAGKWMSLQATVVRCRHVRAMLHEVAVKFEKPIDLSAVLRLPGMQAGDQRPTPASGSSAVPAGSAASLS